MDSVLHKYYGENPCNPLPGLSFHALTGFCLFSRRSHHLPAHLVQRLDECGCHPGREPDLAHPVNGRFYTRSSIFASRLGRHPPQ